MSTEDKIAAIRREVEERRREWVPDTNGARDMLAHHASEGVVIYGVPLSEQETEKLLHCITAKMVVGQHLAGISGMAAPDDRDIMLLREMLERGKG